MPRQAPRVCPTPGCPRLLAPGQRCPDHTPEPFATSTYRTTRGYTPTQRRVILARDHHRCVICGQPATIADHIVPRALGGTDTIDNGQALCDQCSKQKTATEANTIRNTRGSAA